MRAGLEALDPTQPIGFFCERGKTGCFETVWLNGHQYDQGRVDPGWAVLVPGHRRLVELASESAT
jgi:hypothetical protein